MAPTSPTIRACLAILQGPLKAITVSSSHVLLDEDRIPIRVHSDEAGRPRGALVCLLLQRYRPYFQ
jgi:hypothetical protein